MQVALHGAVLFKLVLRPLCTTSVMHQVAFLEAMVEEVAFIFLVTNVVFAIFVTTMFDVTLSSPSPLRQPASSVGTESLASPCVSFDGLRGHTGFTKEGATLHGLREGALRNTCKTAAKR